MIKFEIHPYRCLLLVYRDPAAYSKRTGVVIPSNAAGLCLHRDGCVYVLAGTISDLVHELVHAAQAVLERSRIALDAGDGEVLAFLVQNCTERVLSSSEWKDAKLS